jgi:hypothetical protein
MQIVIASPPMIGCGCAITVIGDSVNQAIYWELVSYDPVTHEEGAPMGALQYDHTKTDAGRCTVNLYMSPTDPADVGKIDRVKVRWGSA